MAISAAAALAKFVGSGFNVECQRHSELVLPASASSMMASGCRRATYSYGDNEIIASSGTQVRSRRFSDHFPTLTN